MGIVRRLKFVLGRVGVDMRFRQRKLPILQDARIQRELVTEFVELAIARVVGEIAEFERLAVTPFHLSLRQERVGIFRRIEDFPSGADECIGVRRRLEGDAGRHVRPGEIVALDVLRIGDHELVILLDRRNGRTARLGAAVEERRTPLGCRVDRGAGQEARRAFRHSVGADAALEAHAVRLALLDDVASIERAQINCASDTADPDAGARPLGDVDAADQVGIDIGLVAISDIAAVGARGLSRAVDHGRDASHALKTTDIGIDRGADVAARRNDARRVDEHVTGGSGRHAINLLARDVRDGTGRLIGRIGREAVGPLGRDVDGVEEKRAVGGWRRRACIRVGGIEDRDRVAAGEAIGQTGAGQQACHRLLRRERTVDAAGLASARDGGAVNQLELRDVGKAIECRGERSGRNGIGANGGARHIRCLRDSWRRSQPRRKHRRRRQERNLDPGSHSRTRPQHHALVTCPSQLSGHGPVQLPSDSETQEPWKRGGRLSEDFSLSDARGSAGRSAGSSADRVSAR
ncbi:hypothetical protein ACVIIV_006086 [Bradyrhizobium sp. USDA 4354]